MSAQFLLDKFPSYSRTSKIIKVVIITVSAFFLFFFLLCVYIIIIVLVNESLYMKYTTHTDVLLTFAINFLKFRDTDVLDIRANIVSGNIETKVRATLGSFPARGTMKR